MNISPENGFTSAKDGHLSSSLGCLLLEDSNFNELTKSAPCSVFDNEDLQDKKEEEEELNQDVFRCRLIGETKPKMHDIQSICPFNK